MMTINLEFVDFIPENKVEGILYISIKYSTIIHLCACDCRNEVVTPLSPIDWELLYDRENLSLNPSIGNWSFNCRSHYWIKKNEIVWAESWSEQRVNTAQRIQLNEKKLYIKVKQEIPEKEDYRRHEGNNLISRVIQFI